MSQLKEWLWATVIAALVCGAGFAVYARFFAPCNPSAKDCGTSVSARTESPIEKSPDEWSPVSKYYFSITLPGAMKETHVSRDEISEKLSDYAVYSAHNGEHIVFIEELLFVPGMAPDAEAFVEDRGALVENAPGAEFTFASDDDFKGNPARRYEYYLPENKQYTNALLVFKSGNGSDPDRYYTLSEASFKDDLRSEDFDAILASFEIK